MAGDKGNRSCYLTGIEFLLWMIKKLWNCIVVWLQNSVNIFKATRFHILRKVKMINFVMCILQFKNGLKNFLTSAYQKTSLRQ